MNLQERLQQLAQQREKLWVALHEINGAMKLLEEQILEIKESSEKSNQKDIKSQTTTSNS